MQTKQSPFLRSLLTALVLLLAPAALLATWKETVEVSIPFSFMVEDEELAAGSYRFSTLQAEPNVVKIESTDGTEELMTITAPNLTETIEESASMETNPLVVFEQFGGSNYLTEIHVPRRSMTWNVTVPKVVEAHLEESQSMRTSVEGRSTP